MNRERITEAELRLMKARCDAATKGPWYAVSSLTEEETGILGGTRPQLVHEPSGEDGPVDLLEDISDETFEYIAQARTDEPRLIAEVERLRAALGEYAHEGNWGKQLDEDGKATGPDLVVFQFTDRGYQPAQQALADEPPEKALSDSA